MKYDFQSLVDALFIYLFILFYFPFFLLFHIFPQKISGSCLSQSGASVESRESGVKVTAHVNGKGCGNGRSEVNDGCENSWQFR